MKELQFSVVVPIYKAEEYLESCVNSVLQQEFDDFELILVDDGSPDNCPDLCDHYLRIDDRVSVIHKNNGGSVSARKAGVEIAKGRYIVFLDSDDWFEKGLLSDLNELIIKYHPSSIVYGYKLFLGNQLSEYYQNTEEGLYNGDNRHRVYDAMISKKPFFSFGIYPTLWTTCAKKEIVLEAQKNVPNEITLGDDAAIVYASLLKSESIYVSKITGCVYRDNPESMTHRFDIKLDKRILALSNYMTTCMQALGLNNISQVHDYITFMTIQVAGNYLLNGGNEFSRTDAIRIVRSFLDQKIINDAIFECDISESSFPISSKVKIMLLRRRWLRLYTILARVFSRIK